MNKKKALRRTLKGICIATATPILLFLLLAVALYIPPLQNLIVHKTAARLSASTGTDIHIERVRLAFPLDLAVCGMKAVEAGGDTLLSARALRVEVALWPLFSGRADIEGFGLHDVTVDTKSYLPDVRVAGRFRELSAASHGVEWGTERVRIDRLLLDGADLRVALSDTARRDTASGTSAWVIDVARADIRRSAAALSLPGDTVRVSLRLGEAALRGGHFDTGRACYALKSLLVRDGAVSYDADTPGALRSSFL